MDTNSQECAYIWTYTLYSCIVTARTSRPNVSRRCFERIVSDWWQWRLGLVSVSILERLIYNPAIMSASSVQRAVNLDQHQMR